MTNFDRLKDTKIGDWFKSINGNAISLSTMARLMYLETNCDICPCRERCGVIKIGSPSMCQSVFWGWLNSEEAK